MQIAPLRPNKRMQLAGALVYGTSDSVQAAKSPQLMRASLDRRKRVPRARIAREDG